MKKKILKLFLIVFASLLGWTITEVVFACGGGEEEDPYYSFFAPEVCKENTYTPFYRTARLLYPDGKIPDTREKIDRDNIKEWSDFFKQRVSGRDLEYLVYSANQTEIKKLVAYFESHTKIDNEELKKNSILKVNDKGKTIAFLQYLFFAKQFDYSTSALSSEWEEENNENNKQSIPDSVAADKTQGKQNSVATDLPKDTIKDWNTYGLREMEKSSFPFIRQRYLFQVIRNCYQQADYEAGVNYYQTYAGAYQEHNSIIYRTMGYAAACLYKQQLYAEANYLYALIYDQYEPMKAIAYLGFHPQEEQDWNECINNAKNIREKTALWQLLGIYANDPLRAMKEIYTMDPSSDLMDLLLVRAVNITEEKMLPTRDSYFFPASSTYELRPDSASKEFVDFVIKTAEQQKVHKPYLWRLAAGYLLLVQKKYAAADMQLNTALSLIKNDSLVSDQVRSLRLISKIQQQTIPNEDFETVVIPDLQYLDEHINQLRNGYVLEWALKRLSEKYYKAGIIDKAHLLNTEYDPLFYFDEKKITKTIQFITRPDKSPFDQFLLRKYTHSLQNLYAQKAVALLYEFKLKEAITAWEYAPDQASEQMEGDPFTIHINDCHDCDHTQTLATPYSKMSFTKKLFELQQKIKSDPTHASQYYFELANGYYNMTYFGNARMIYQTQMHYYGQFYFPLYESASYYMGYNLRKDLPFLSCKQAEFFYKKAMELSTDKEFKAKCCFMAAKAEQNTFFISRPKGYNGDFKSGNYFSLLNSTYKQTKYYQEVIEECGYFKTYVDQTKQ